MRVHPLLELDRGELLGRALGRLAVHQRLDDAVDEQPRGASSDERRDDDDEDRQDVLAEERQDVVQGVLSKSGMVGQPTPSGRGEAPSDRSAIRRLRSAV